MLRSALATLISLFLSTTLYANTVVIENVNVIPMTGKGLQSKRTVVIEDGVIQAIQKKSKNISSDALIIDGTGKYLIPGLWDMHVHLNSQGPTALPMLLANGVTSIREAGGDHRVNLKLRDDVATGKRIGPRIKTCGMILESKAFIQRLHDRNVADGVEFSRIGIDNAEEAQAAVQRLKSMGVDFIKVRTAANKNTHKAIVDAAKDAGLKVAGHADYPYHIMIDSGQLSWEHTPTALLNNKNEKERRSLYRDMSGNGVVMVPTLVNYDYSILKPINYVEEIVENQTTKNSAHRSYVSQQLLGSWREQVIDRKESATRNWDKLLESSYRNLREMYNEGVRILPGTDTGVVLIYPGFSLHDELGQLVKHVGMTPHQALIAATSHCAEFMDMEKTLGTIEKGKQADLLLLTANPLDDIRNTQEIETVFAQKNMYTRDQLDTMLSNVEEQVRSEK
jgi:imidazolonepropionase-like amidohydrolase